MPTPITSPAVVATVAARIRLMPYPSSRVRFPYPAWVGARPCPHSGDHRRLAIQARRYGCPLGQTSGTGSLTPCSAGEHGSARRADVLVGAHGVGSAGS